MANKEFSTIPIYGDPIMMNGTVAALSGNSLYWTIDNVDYYLAGSDLSTNELNLSFKESIFLEISYFDKKSANNINFIIYYPYYFFSFLFLTLQLFSYLFLLFQHQQ